MHSMILLNTSGDITISWDSENKEALENLVQSKLDKGYLFFIIEPKFLGLFNKKLKLNKGDVLKSKGKLVIPDETIDKFHIQDDDIADFLKTKNVALSVSKTPTGPLETTVRTDNAKTIVDNTTVVIKPIQGG